MKTLIKLEQPGCNPCKMVSEHLERLDVDYETYDVTEEEGMDLASEFGVMGVPVTILLNDGVEVQRSVGFKPGELEDMVEELNK